MIESLEHILDAYSAGRLNRRDAALAVLGLTAAVARPARAAPGSSPTFKATGLNHLALRVRDVGASRSFYSTHLGASVIRDNSPNGPCFLRTGGHYLGLFPSASAGLDHFCYTVEGYEAGAALARLEALGLPARRVEDRVYFHDPDGLEVQLDSRLGSWPGTPPDDIR